MTSTNVSEISLSSNSSRTHTLGHRNTALQLELVNQQFLSQGPRYLIVGVGLGVLGFLIASIPYAMDVLTLVVEGREIQKVPSTVSEMVSQWKTVQARVFFGFELTAANLILLSWYPFKLRSACCLPATGGCRMRCGCCNPSWASFRQFVPPIGLILVACVPTCPSDKMVGTNLVLVVVHCCSALVMFAGFLMSEAHSLSITIPFTGFAPLRCATPPIHPDTDKQQYRARLATWYVAFLSWAFFSWLQTVGTFISISRRWQVLSFSLEVIAGLAMLFNHYAIWLYSAERRFSERGILSGATTVNLSGATTVELPSGSPSSSPANRRAMDTSPA